MKTLRLWKTKAFKKWIGKLDAPTRKRIYLRLDKAAELGHFGDHHGVKGADQISEMRFDFAHGYRVYYSIVQDALILLLLTGGDKSTQDQDIERAKRLLPDAIIKAKKEIEEEKKREQTKQ